MVQLSRAESVLQKSVVFEGPYQFPLRMIAQNRMGPILVLRDAE